MSPEEEEGGKPRALDLTAIDVDNLLALFIGVLAAKAWQYMGLQLAPGDKEAKKDMARASVAIDCLSYMADKLAPLLPESEVGRLRSMITDLKINYAKNV